MALDKIRKDENGNWVWRCRVMINGKKISKSFFGIDAQVKATQYQLRLKSSKHAPEDKTGLTFSELLQFAKPGILNRISPQSRYVYEARLSKLCEMCGDKIIKTFNPAYVQHIQSQLQSQGYACGTINQYCSLIKMIFDYAVLDGIFDNNIVLPIKRLKHDVPTSIRKTLSIDLFFDIINRIPKEKEWLKNALICMFTTGIRKSEFISLTWNSIDFDNRCIFIKCTQTFTTKNRIDRLVPMSDLVYTILQQNKQDQTSIPFPDFEGKAVNGMTLYDNWKRIIRAYAKLHNLKDFHFRLHDLRHSAADILKDVISIQSLQKLLGHCQIQQTLLYSQSSSQQALQELERKKNPFNG